MSATIIQFPLRIEEPTSDSISIPTMAQHLHGMCFSREKTREAVLRSCLCISLVSNAAIRRDEGWEGGKLSGYVWRFPDNSVLAITVEHDWAC